MDEPAWISADQALAKLGVKAQTLYAYVSRGRVRSRPDPEDSRRALYARHDVDRLIQSRSSSRRRSDIASHAIAWGEPVLDTSISTVRDGQLYFGPDQAVELAEHATLEEMAALHWHTDAPLPETERAAQALPAGNFRARGYLALATRAADALPLLGRHRDVLIEEACTLLFEFANAMMGEVFDGPIHARLAAMWSLPADGVDLVRRTLVLLSDHELNPSTFAVRVAAATGTSLPGAVLSGYAALNGPRHGEASTLALAVLRDVERGGSVRDGPGVQAGLSSKRFGYGHPLYPDGDCRAAHVLARLPEDSSARRGVDKIASELGERPNIDAALAALAVHYDLPDAAPLQMFAIARMAGWIAHALEQVASGQLIRPRAHFTPRIETQ